MSHISIALDGPAGVGKSTIAKSLAKRLGYIYIDTGAMYRALAVYFLEQGLTTADQEKICSAAEQASVSIAYQEGEQHVFLNGRDVTAALRTEAVSCMASSASQYQPVRDKLTGLQRALAARENVIMDGRDIGTVVLPDAQLKIFLTADPAVRAKRRYLQLKAQNRLEGATLESIEAELEERDYRDAHRANAPLKQAEDAVLLDSSRCTAAEVETQILALLSERLSAMEQAEENTKGTAGGAEEAGGSV